MKMLVLAVAILAVSGCEAEPMHRASSENRDVKVDVLTEFDGVRVYRMWDGGSRPIYIVISKSQLRAEWDEQQGKTVVSRESVTLR